MDGQVKDLKSRGHSCRSPDLLICKVLYLVGGLRAKPVESKWAFGYGGPVSTPWPLVFPRDSYWPVTVGRPFCGRGAGQEILLRQ